MGQFNRQFRTNPDDYSWDINPYYNPEKCGLELLYSIDEPDMCYEYNTIIVVKDVASGAIFIGANSGCSCPTPFEDFDGLDKFTRVKKIEDYDKFVDAWTAGSYSDFRQSDIRDVRRKLARRLK